MTPEEEIKKLREDVRKLQDGLRNRRPDPVLLPLSFRIMFVTSDIDAMTGDDTGSGTAVDGVYDTATGKMTAGTGADQEVRNYHEKKFLSGGIIAAFPLSGTLWACDVNKCAKYN